MGVGGAIYANNNTNNKYPVTINAVGKNVEFTNNRQGVSDTRTGGTYNDITLAKSETGNKTMLNLNASEGKTITFNGTVVSTDSNPIIVLNNHATYKGGDYIFNNTVSGGFVDVHNGANIKLGSHEQTNGTTSYGSFNVAQFTTDANVTSIDSKNGYTEGTASSSTRM